MPHIHVEYANVPAKTIDDLVAALHARAAGIGIFNIGAIRVLAFEATSASVGNGGTSASWVNIAARLRSGRTTEVINDVLAQLADTAEGVLAEQFDQGKLGLHVELTQFTEEQVIQKNNMV